MQTRVERWRIAEYRNSGANPSSVFEAATGDLPVTLSKGERNEPKDIATVFTRFERLPGITPPDMS